MRRTYKNQPEELFCKWIEEKGYYPIKRGWPDFFCRDPKTGDVIVVEVKPYPGEYLKVEQYIVMEFLTKHGIKCYRWNPVSKTLELVKSRRTLPQDTVTDVSSSWGFVGNKRTSWPYTEVTTDTITVKTPHSQRVGKSKRNGKRRKRRMSLGRGRRPK